jgi:N-acetylmuramoyl-L-alanine amidase
LHLKSADIHYRAFTLGPMNDRPFRVVVDVESPKIGKRIKEKRQTVGKQKVGEDRVVVIDPGHGGEDPGAIGPTGTKEKDVVFAVAKALRRRLDRRPGLRAFLTRTGDYFLGLRERVQIAQDYGADLFLSIHADASRNKNIHGASVYCLSTRGATDEAARILAEKENAADLIGGVQLNRDHDLNTILLDLVQTQTINDGLRFGGMVLEEMEKTHRIKFTMPRQAGFRVLKAPDIPSILVELGFLTNPQDEKSLKSSAFQKQLAHTLEASACRFLCEPGPANPEHFRLAFCGDPTLRAHVVQPGQNLSQIAALYHTSVRKIQRHNKLTDVSRIYPGQKIMIP